MISAAAAAAGGKDVVMEPLDAGAAAGTREGARGPPGPPTGFGGKGPDTWKYDRNPERTRGAMALSHTAQNLLVSTPCPGCHAVGGLQWLVEWYGLEEFPQALCTQCGWDSRDGCPVDPEPGLSGRGAQGPLYENNMRGAGIVENGHIGRAEFRELMRRLGMGDYSDEIHADAATFVGKPSNLERYPHIKLHPAEADPAPPRPAAELFTPQNLLVAALAAELALEWAQIQIVNANFATGAWFNNAAELAACQRPEDHKEEKGDAGLAQPQPQPAPGPEPKPAPAKPEAEPEAEPEAKAEPAPEAAAPAATSL